MGSGAAPGGTARNPTRATLGALGQANPAGGMQRWLKGITLSASVAGTFILYDRLADISGLNATTTTAQTITGLAVNRYTGAASAGNQILLEIYTIIGTTATTITASYTNQDGTAGRTTPAVAFGGTGLREAQRAIIMPLQAGDTGVRSVENVDLLASTATAGDFGVTIVRPVTVAPCSLVGSGTVRDLIAGLPGPFEVQTDACLFMVMLANTTTAPQVIGSAHFIEA
jgi:hypothetical protein